VHDQPPPAVPPLSPTITLLVVARQVEAALEAALEALGLTRRQLGVLGHLARAPGISFTELAGRASVTVQSMHVIVRALERDGLLVAGAGQRGRPATITLTAEGRQRLATGLAAVAAIDRTQFDERDPQRRRLADALRAIAREEGPGA
jgi:DNA-binding MarR family transcriptional regulator